MLLWAWDAEGEERGIGDVVERVHDVIMADRGHAGRDAARER